MSFDKTFSITELTIGSLNNKISIDSTGNMTFTDGITPTITLEELSQLADSITFDSLVDTTDSTVNNKYVLRKTTDGWITEEDSNTEAIVVEIEITDWVNGGDNWSVEIPHNLNLTLPDNLLFVQVWDNSFTEEKNVVIKQESNAVIITSPTQSTLYVTMR